MPTTLNPSDSPSQNFHLTTSTTPASKVSHVLSCDSFRFVVAEISLQSVLDLADALANVETLPVVEPLDHSPARDVAQRPERAVLDIADTVYPGLRKTTSREKRIAASGLLLMGTNSPIAKKKLFCVNTLGVHPFKLSTVRGRRFFSLADSCGPDVNSSISTTLLLESQHCQGAKNSTTRNPQNHGGWGIRGYGAQTRRRRVSRWAKKKQLNVQQVTKVKPTFDTVLQVAETLTEAAMTGAGAEYTTE